MKKRSGWSPPANARSVRQSPGRRPRIYCYNDRSEAKPNPVACICPTCDVYKNKNFIGTNYYCITGRPMTKIAGAELHEAVSGGK